MDGFVLTAQRSSVLALVFLGCLTTPTRAGPSVCDSLVVGLINPPPGANSASITSLSPESHFPYLDNPTAWATPHCLLRGAIDVDPSHPSIIRFQMRLPVSEDWNGKFMMGGDGAYAGNETREADLQSIESFSFDTSFVHPALVRGYATATTDTGHQANEPDWALDDPPSPGIDNEAEIGYAYNGVHLTALLAKDIVQAYYGPAPQYSYFVGCSNGGRQGLMEAARFPSDFDGIISGAPLVTHGTAHSQKAALWRREVQRRQIATWTIEKQTLITATALEKCDEIDGVVDGILNDPRECRPPYYVPERDLPMCRGRGRATEYRTLSPEGDLSMCRGGGEATDCCFTTDEIQHLRSLYGGAPAGLITGFAGQKPINAGFSVSSENPESVFRRPNRIGWPRRYYFAQLPDGSDLETFALGNFILDQPSLMRSEFNAYLLSHSKEEIVRDIEMWMADFSVSADLSTFASMGGKVLIYHGWIDNVIPAERSIMCRANVIDALGASTVDDFLRLYMMPGVSHCIDGSGVQFFNGMGVLEDWVENGNRPDEIPAVNFFTSLTVKNLCPYPEAVAPDGLTCLAP